VDISVSYSLPEGRVRFGRLKIPDQFFEIRMENFGDKHAAELSVIAAFLHSVHHVSSVTQECKIYLATTP
jgi:hypothetical protein